jgi:hypothetical protein
VTRQHWIITAAGVVALTAVGGWVLSALINSIDLWLGAAIVFFVCVAVIVWQAAGD